MEEQKNYFIFYPEDNTWLSVEGENDGNLYLEPVPKMSLATRFENLMMAEAWANGEVSPSESQIQFIFSKGKVIEFSNAELEALGFDFENRFWINNQRLVDVEVFNKEGLLFKGIFKAVLTQNVTKGTFVLVELPNLVMGVGKISRVYRERETREKLKEIKRNSIPEVFYCFDQNVFNASTLLKILHYKKKMKEGN